TARTENGTAIGRSRTKPGPRIDQHRVGDRRHELRRAVEETLNGAGPHLLVESRGMVLGGTDHDAAIVAGDEIDGGAVERMAEERAGGLEQQHLALDWIDGDLGAQAVQESGPGAAGEDDNAGRVAFS